MDICQLLANLCTDWVDKMSSDSFSSFLIVNHGLTVLNGLGLWLQGGLPMYLATRGLYNLKPPTVFVPPCIKEDVVNLLEIHRRMSQVELKLDLVALGLGMHLIS